MKNHANRRAPNFKSRIRRKIKNVDPADFIIYPTITSLVVFFIGSLVADGGNVNRYFVLVGGILLLPLLLFLALVFSVAPSLWAVEKVGYLLSELGLPKLISSIISYLVAFLVFLATSFIFMYLLYHDGDGYYEIPIEQQLPWL